MGKLRFNLYTQGPPPRERLDVVRVLSVKNLRLRHRFLRRLPPPPLVTHPGARLRRAGCAGPQRRRHAEVDVRVNRPPEFILPGGLRDETKVSHRRDAAVNQGRLFAHLLNPDTLLFHLSTPTSTVLTPQRQPASRALFI